MAPPPRPAPRALHCGKLPVLASAAAALRLPWPRGERAAPRWERREQQRKAARASEAWGQGGMGAPGACGAKQRLPSLKVISSPGEGEGAAR